MLDSVFYKSIFIDYVILVLRVFAGVLLIHHGFEKLNGINNFADAFLRPLHLPFPVALSYIAAVFEIWVSWFLILGLGTRLCATAILGTMSVAIYHWLVTSGFNIYLLELLALYFASAFLMVLFGPGRFSADYLIKEILNSKPDFMITNMKQGLIINDSSTSMSKKKISQKKEIICISFF